MHSKSSLCVVSLLERERKSLLESSSSSTMTMMNDIGGFQKFVDRVLA